MAGGSGTGKTTIAKAVKKLLPAITIISLDSYYNDNSHLSLNEREKLNFDQPSAFDFDLLLEQMRLLKKGFSVEKPIYSYIRRTREKETETIDVNDIIFIEGILLFYDNRITDLLDYKYYIDLDEKIRLENIIKRDVSERGRKKEEVVERFYKEVNPMHSQYVSEQKLKADMVFNDVSLSKIVNKIINQLKSEKLC